MPPQSTRAALTVIGAAAVLCFFCCVFLVRRPLSARSLLEERRHHRGEQVVSLQQEFPDGNAENRSARDHDFKREAATLLTKRDVPELQVEDVALQKRAFSSKMRLIFPVGLEGTGHHYLSGALEKLCQKELGACRKVCTLAEALYPGMTNAEDVSAYKAFREKIREEMQTLARYPGSLQEEEAIIVRLGPCRPNHSGMMSYPNFSGPDKALQYVDFRVVAEEAERAGVDLRIIYLARPARDIFSADTRRHHYEKTWLRSNKNRTGSIVSRWLSITKTNLSCSFRGKHWAEEKNKTRSCSANTAINSVVGVAGAHCCSEYSSSQPPDLVVIVFTVVE